jgi:pimeloyl-ACP methyl ester carboxylesterase
VVQNEDGTYTWKFDNYVRVFLPYDMPQSDIEALWHNIASPSLMVYGKESWASDPRTDGRAAHFKDATFVQIAGAGHWVHHDQLDTFMKLVEPFLKGEALPQGVPGVT